MQRFAENYSLIIALGSDLGPEIGRFAKIQGRAAGVEVAAIRDPNAVEARLRQSRAASSQINTLLTNNVDLARRVLASNQDAQVLFYPDDPFTKPDLSEKAIVLDDISVPEVIERSQQRRQELRIFRESFNPRDPRENPS